MINCIIPVSDIENNLFQLEEVECLEYIIESFRSDPPGFIWSMILGMNYHLSLPTVLQLC